MFFPDRKGSSGSAGNSAKGDRLNFSVGEVSGRSQVEIENQKEKPQSNFWARVTAEGYSLKIVFDEIYMKYQFSFLIIQLA